MLCYLTFRAVFLHILGFLPRAVISKLISMDEHLEREGGRNWILWRQINLKKEPPWPLSNPQSCIGFGRPGPSALWIIHIWRLHDFWIFVPPPHCHYHATHATHQYYSPLQWLPPPPNAAYVTCEWSLPSAGVVICLTLAAALMKEWGAFSFHACSQHIRNVRRNHTKNWNFLHFVIFRYRNIHFGALATFLLDTLNKKCCITISAEMTPKNWDPRVMTLSTTPELDLLEWDPDHWKESDPYEESDPLRELDPYQGRSIGQLNPSQ